MKLPFTLSSEKTALLTGHQAALQKIATRHTALVKKRDNYLATETKVLAAIEKLEGLAGDGTDEEAALKLAGRQHQIRLLRNTIASVNAEIEQFFAGASSQVRAASAAIKNALGPMKEHEIQRIIGLVGDCFRQEIFLRNLADGHFHSVLYIGDLVRNFTSPPMGDGDEILAAAIQQLRMIENILAGRDIFPDLAEDEAGAQAKEERLRNRSSRVLEQADSAARMREIHARR
jgi:hypothetical protein